MASDIVSSIEDNDHGGTFNGNPLGCAVASAVIEFMVSKDIGRHIERIGNNALLKMQSCTNEFPTLIKEARGKGLLLALELFDPEKTAFLYEACLKKGLILNIKHGNIIRIFPALTITEHEINEGLSITKNIIESI